MAHKKGVKRKYWWAWDDRHYSIRCYSCKWFAASSTSKILLGEFSTSNPPRLKGKGKYRSIVINHGRNQSVLYTVQELVTADRVAKMFLKS